MGDTLQTTIDSAGRLVLPKAVREEVGILPGMTLRITVQEGKVEIEPLPREVQIVQRGPLWIAVPAEAGPALSEATVDQVLRKVREQKGGAQRILTFNRAHFERLPGAGLEIMVSGSAQSISK